VRTRMCQVSISLFCLLNCVNLIYLGSLLSKETSSEDWDNVLAELEEILDYKFKNIKFLKEALIHDSYYSFHGNENSE